MNKEIPTKPVEEINAEVLQKRQEEQAKEDMKRFFKGQMELKKLQLELQTLNTSIAQSRAEEMKWLAVLAQYSGPAPVEDDEVVDHVLSAEDMTENPDLVTQGLKTGDTIQVPKRALKKPTPAS